MPWDGSAIRQRRTLTSRHSSWPREPTGGSAAGTSRPAGIWVFAVAPYMWLGSDDDGTATGRLVGFLILHDRDEDGTYESLAHIWTASTWRRRGIARKMLAEARRRGYWPSSALTAGRLDHQQAASGLVDIAVRPAVTQHPGTLRWMPSGPLCGTGTARAGSLWQELSMAAQSQCHDRRLPGASRADRGDERPAIDGHLQGVGAVLTRLLCASAGSPSLARIQGYGSRSGARRARRCSWI
jgi:GNAT superfamily N-acetyltransferase